jgi:hypothetical protein
MPYRLVRTTPLGDVRQHTDLRTLRHCGQAMAYSLVDNGACDKKSASRLAFHLETLPLGTPVPAYGYVFRIESEG